MPSSCYFPGSIVLLGLALASVPETMPLGPRSPEAEKATFHLPKGFQVELVAAEPQIVDPVALAFDEEGRLFVAEMPGYPNGGVATGNVTSGRIKLLEDRDGDGIYEQVTVFADCLRFPTGLTPWRGGLLVANAPDLIYLEDRDGDGRAEQRRVLYTGFDTSNIQQLLNSLQWGLDNWIYGCAGLAGGVVRSLEKPELPAVALHGRGIRFRPDQPGSLEPTTGGGQYGLTQDDWGNWFTATNSQHLRHLVLPDSYLRRNPFLGAAQLVADIPDHGPACRVYRLSPFEPWRVERTQRRKSSLEASRFPASELVPGGYITSACSPLVYTADLFPPEYQGSVFVCDPANNLIHRDVLQRQGVTFTARRGEANMEFWAATDPWFRPVGLTLGPDGALYVADFYREVIETPLSLPADLKARLQGALRSQGRGRIWRLAPVGTPRRPRPALRRASTAEWVAHLKDRNSWWRLTCQRLLIERRDPAALPLLHRLLRDSCRSATTQSAVTRLSCLWTLDALGDLTEQEILESLADPVAEVRVHALRLAESRLERSAGLRQAVAACADDPQPSVRLQAAFTLGASRAPEMKKALVGLAQRQAGDPWLATALLSSASASATELLQTLLSQAAAAGPQQPTADRAFLHRLAAVVGAQADDAALAGFLCQLARLPGEKGADWRQRVLWGLFQGRYARWGPLTALWQQPPPALRTALAQVRPFFAEAAQCATAEQASLAERQRALRLLAYGPFPLVESACKQLLRPQTPKELQQAAVQALGQQAGAASGALLLSAWSSYSPSLRREVLSVLFAERSRLEQLLAALEQGRIPLAQLEPNQRALLAQHPEAALRQRAQRLLSRQSTPSRQGVLARYRKALELRGDPQRGRKVFQKTCTSCHRLEGVGHEVGPDLLAALGNKTPEALLVDILDPNREVDPRYEEYLVVTRSGQVYTGLIAAETAASLTLRRAEQVEETLLRSQIESLQGTGRSLMPEGLEQQLTLQDLTDLLAYLQHLSRP